MIQLPGIGKTSGISKNLLGLLQHGLGMGGDGWWLRPIFVFSLSLDQAEQQTKCLIYNMNILGHRTVGYDCHCNKIYF